MEKIRIGGIKQSRELVQVNLLQLPPEQNPLSHLCRLMAENRINMPFVTGACKQGKAVNISFCVSAEDEVSVRGLLESEGAFGEHGEFIPMVGMITIYPHRSSFQILGLVLKAWEHAQLPLYGLATSLSALACTTDYSGMNTAVSALKKFLSLPTDHAPFDTEIRVIQSRLIKKE